MKSGRKIFKRVVMAECQATAVQALGNGNLRSLIRHVTKDCPAGTEIGETILALAMCEVTARFIKVKGQLF